MHLGLATLPLQGKCLDLGAGSSSPSYRAYLSPDTADWTYTDWYQSGPNIISIDLEKPFNLKSRYDSIVCLNVMEHVFHARELLHSISSHLSKDGKAIIATPFLFPLHPSPHDYWRFSPEAYRQLASRTNLQVETVYFLGKGPFIAGLSQIWLVLPKWLRSSATIVAWGLDSLLLANSRMFDQTHALGFLVVLRPPKKRIRKSGT